MDAYVLTCEFEGASPWDDDISGMHERIIRLKRKIQKVPFYLRTLPNTFVQKIRWKLSYWVAPKKVTHTYEDLSTTMIGDFLNKAMELITEKNITDVILTGGPFHFSTILVDIKTKFPLVRTVLDYRDYWEDFFAGMNENQVQNGKQIQLNVIKSVDIIIAPNEEMADHYKKRFAKHTLLLPHCFDEDDIKRVSAAKTDSTKMKLVYGGAFYSDLSKELLRTRNVIDAINKLVPCHAEFFVSLRGYESELTHPSITRSGFVPSSLYFNTVAAADYSLVILPPNRANAMSSKFFELVALRKPIIYVGDSGTVSEFITKNKLGFCFTNDAIEFVIKSVIDHWRSKNEFNENFDASEYTFAKQTKRLLEQLV